MSTTFFGFAIADGMFNGDCTISRKVLNAEEVLKMIQEGVTPCLNPSHKVTIDAMRTRYEIDVQIPPTAPKVCMGVGDRVIVMGVRGLPRLEGRGEFTADEIAKATFTFSLFTVVS